MTFQFLNGGLDGFGKAVQSSFTNAVYAFVRIHTREDPILPRVAGNISGDVSYFHAVNPISSHQVLLPCGGTVANKSYLVTASASESCAPMQGSNPRL
jgi:hypothetical protein